VKKVTKIDGVQKNTAINSKLRVAAYCRVSTGSDAQLESLEAQKSHYEQYINSHEDWQFAGLYFDEGITGTKAEKRPELLRLITDCEARRIDFVITKSISRFSRNTTDCLALVRKLQSLDIPIYFEKENINTGSMESELFLAILSSMAEGESASISENAKWSVKRRFQNGTYKLGYTPYGYDWDGKNMIINPDQAAVVKRIFADILSGKSTNAIADELNAEKVPSKKNTNWTSSTIRGILANEKYTGDVIFQKTYTDENFNRHTNYGEVDQYMAPDHHEAIISHSDFDAANALVNQRAAEKSIEKGSDKYQQRYAFSGKIICGECRDTFKRRIHSCTTYKYVAWACNTHLKNKESCHMKYVRDDEIKAAFITMLNKLIYGYRLILTPYLKILENSSGDAAKVTETNLLLHFVSHTDMLTTYSEELFENYADHIEVMSRNEIRFVMKCGLTFTERIGD
jgi:DNA invertase Pin-like site-specific DNA recombinase